MRKMKYVFFALCFVLFALEVNAQSAKERGKTRADEIVKFLKIYDKMQIEKIEIACEDYYVQDDKIEEEADPEKRKIKHLRNDQKFESRLKSVTSPEQYRNYEVGLKNKKKKNHK
jgi:hypothetical protein